jgi:hypothetical protein
MKLTLAQQRALIKTLPPSRKNAVKKHCHSCQMKGEGLMDILRSVKKHLGNVARFIGPTALKEFIVPFLKKKAGLGLYPAGMGSCGKGLKLVGQGRRRH